MEVLIRKIMALLNTKQNHDRRSLAERLDLRGAERKLLNKALRQMVRDGQIRERQGRYSLSPPQAAVEGIFSGTDKGYGFVIVDDRQEDVFIPAQHVGSTMDGDRVRVSLRKSPRDRRQYGEITDILTRAHSRIVGAYQLHQAGALVMPQGVKLAEPIRVNKEAGIADGDLVEVAIEHYPQAGVLARGRIIEHLGAADDPQVDIAAVIRAKKLPDRFSAATMQQAQVIAAEVVAEDLAGRHDLRQLPLVTIDGETARDFDDAVALKQEPDGSFRLWVCIADVAHYVAPGSPIDLDAQERGTSVYFPGFVVPMLPETLSNGICSLNPQVDRLVMTAELQISRQGETIAARFYPAVMNSYARLTYTQVAACLDQQQGGLSEALTTQLKEMEELSEILSQMRYARGSLNLDIPEVEICVDESGRPLKLVKIERNAAHRLIEEFMLAANEAVARYLGQQGWPLLYRVHTPPDHSKLEELQQLAASSGHGLVLGKDLHRSLQKLLEEVADQPEGRLLNQQLLRSLQQAVYTPHNEGHFGLAAEDYCHFTSPIRRYPDLVIHRALKLALAGESKNGAPSVAQLETLGARCSAQERRAMEAERDLADLRRCQLMAGRIGEEFSAIVASVLEFGLFVELDELLIEGLVHMRSMQGDYYHFDPVHRTLTGERQRQQFHMGMPVQVKLERVDLARRRIDFSLVDARGLMGQKKTSARRKK